LETIVVMDTGAEIPEVEVEVEIEVELSGMARAEIPRTKRREQKIWDMC